MSDYRRTSTPPDQLTITVRATADRTILTLKPLIGDVRLFGFRNVSHPFSPCEECGASVLPEWFAHHAKWHFDERMRNFGGF
jgi:hypothetical protein